MFDGAKDQSILMQLINSYAGPGAIRFCARFFILVATTSQREIYLPQQYSVQDALSLTPQSEGTPLGAGILVIA